MVRHGCEVTVAPKNCNRWTCSGCCHRMAREHISHFCPHLLAAEKIFAAVLGAGLSREWKTAQEYLRRAEANWLKYQPEGEALLLTTAPWPGRPFDAIDPGEAAALLEWLLLTLRPRVEPKERIGVIRSCKAWQRPPRSRTGAVVEGVAGASGAEEVAATMRELGGDPLSFSADGERWRVKNRSDTPAGASALARTVAARLPSIAP